MSEKPEPTGIKVLVKAMRIIDLITADPAAELSLIDISSRLKLNKSTCHHILDTLVSGDYIEKSGPGKYRLGIRLFLAGSRLQNQLSVRERALSVMEELQRRLGETVFLYVRRGDEAICVERLDGQYSTTHLMRVGDALPLHVGASPKIFLASAPDNEIEAYFDRVRNDPSPRFNADQPRLWRDIQAYRNDGYILSARDIEKSTSAVGAAIKNHLGQVVGALSISWVEQLSTNSEAEIRDEIIEAAKRISFSLGYTEQPTKGFTHER